MRGKVYTTIIAIMLVFAYAALAHAESALPESFISKDGVRMHHVASGEFLMGTDHPMLSSTAPTHKVYVSGFYMDEHPVTNRQFAAFLSDMFKSTDPPIRKQWVVLRTDLASQERQQWWPTEIGFEYGKYIAYEGFKNYPAITINWDAADKYCRWAGKRLPTEAEWEKAARGGLSQMDYTWGNESPIKTLVYNRVWLTNASPPPTGPVKGYLPNGYGLYDMAGLVWEWCADWYSPDYYKSSPLDDPRGPAEGVEKSQRGGGWSNPAGSLYVAVRNYLAPDGIDETTGFRCAADESAASQGKTSKQ